jgi:hypothetical protein
MRPTALILVLLAACASETECPEPRGFVRGRLEDHVDLSGQLCQSTRSDECPAGIVDLDSRLTLVDVARRFRVDGQGVAEDACESRTVVAGFDGSRASGAVVYDGDGEWSWTLSVTNEHRTCCYVGRMAGDPSRL